LILVEESHFRKHGHLRLVLGKHQVDEAADDVQRIRATGRRLGQPARHGLAGAAIALEHQVFLVLEVVVERRAGDTDADGDDGHGGTVIDRAFKGLLCASSAACGLLATAPALAADANDAANATTALPELVVTAQKRAQSVQTIPAAVTALSGASLEQRGIT